MLLGAVIGVFAATGWPARERLAAADARLRPVDRGPILYSDRQLHGTFVEGQFQWYTPAGSILLAAAAWQVPRIAVSSSELSWRAIALPILCQVFAIGIQVYGLNFKLEESERLMAALVGVLVVVQLLVATTTA